MCSADSVRAERQRLDNVRPTFFAGAQPHQPQSINLSSKILLMPPPTTPLACLKALMSAVDPQERTHESGVLRHDLLYERVLDPYHGPTLQLHVSSESSPATEPSKVIFGSVVLGRAETVCGTVNTQFQYFSICPRLNLIGTGISIAIYYAPIKFMMIAMTTLAY